jgi:hypothetical protein
LLIILFELLVNAEKVLLKEAIRIKFLDMLLSLVLSGILENVGYQRLGGPMDLLIFGSGVSIMISLEKNKGKTFSLVDLFSKKSLMFSMIRWKGVSSGAIRMLLL